ncbi:retinol dehydrogenase 11 isoform X2 [Harpegnathos saltator]|uniref:retinol dehydrogenase 11 isoform X2 n=1 Tax=Harpegnathos saltator TaxID=610380 RepID=UPI00058BC3AD|nr:retinol dehydrogenase 11 isoform X2 [Harpegnathos saltator]
MCARVILACRNMERATEALEDITNNPPSGIEKTEYQQGAGELAIYILDLCSLRSVRDCAKSLLRQEAAVHILVNNAGVAVCPYEKTEDGHEVQLQTNYLGHFLLTLLLLPKMQSSLPGYRIVNVSSIIHRFGNIYFDDINLEKSYAAWKSYKQSKLANVLFTRELARRLEEAGIRGINVYSVHPGYVPTKISQYSSRTMFNGAKFCYGLLTRMVTRNIEQGAQTTIYCSVDERAANETGLYYSKCSVATPHRRTGDVEFMKKLWDVSCQLLHLEPEEDLNVFLNTVSCQIAE